ncbi:hypothetical protein OAS86_04120 [Gammaproteobacteria bacterium]|nr:hypothetical protein [Gammaproteobacteria bacterium]
MRKPQSPLTPIENLEARRRMEKNLRHADAINHFLLTTLLACSMPTASADLKITSKANMALDRTPEATLEVLGSGGTANAIVRVKNGNNTVALAVDSVGKVGIGTETPADLLDIASGDASSGLRFTQINQSTPAQTASPLAVTTNGEWVINSSSNPVSFNRRSGEVPVGTVSSEWTLFNVTFSAPFASGVTPRIILSITDDSHSGGEQVTTLKMESISNTGFSFRLRDAATPSTYNTVQYLAFQEI